MSERIDTEHTAYELIRSLTDSRDDIEIKDLIDELELDDSDKSQLSVQIKLFFKTYTAQFRTMDSDDIQNFVFHGTEPIEQILSKYPQIVGDERQYLMSAFIGRMMAEFSNAEKFRYVVLASPLWSKLKRLLLRMRAHGNQKQYQYIMDSYSKDLKFNDPQEKEAFNASIKQVSQTNDYRDFNEMTVKKLVSMLVSKETNCRFGAIMENWKADEEDRDSGIKQADIATLYRIAYAFRLNPSEFDRMIRGNLGYGNKYTFVWYPLDAKSNIYRFGLTFDMTFRDAEDLINTYSDDYEPEHPVSRQEAEQKINDFLDEHADDCTTPQEEFCALLAELGCSCDVSADSKQIRAVRLEIAEKKLEELLNLLTEERVKKIRVAYQQAQNSLTAGVFVPEIQSIVQAYSDMMDGCPNCETDAMKIYSFLDNNVKLFSERFAKNKLNVSEKCSMLHYLCDEEHVYTMKKNGLAGDSLSTQKLNTILGDTLVKITRGDILRLAYLHALILLLTEELDTNDALRFFTEEADEMLNASLYHPVHGTIPHDLIICFALTEQSRFRPLVYQMFLPRKNGKL